MDTSFLNSEKFGEIRSSKFSHDFPGPFPMDTTRLPVFSERGTSCMEKLEGQNNGPGVEECLTTLTYTKELHSLSESTQCHTDHENCQD